MSKKVVLVMVMMLVGLVAVMGHGVASADDSGGVFHDGRLNGNDVAAPVFVYYTYSPAQVLDADGNVVWHEDGTLAWTDVVTRIELWAVDDTDAGHKVLSVAVEEINDAVAMAEGEGVIIAEASGFSLGYSPDGYFWITAVSDYEGNPTFYHFEWQDDHTIINS